MSYINLDDTELIVPIAPANINGVIINRKVHVHTTQLEQTDKRVVLHAQVFYYGEDGVKIEPRTGDNDIGITPYMRKLVSDNTHLADAATGMKICPVSEEYIDGEDEDERVLNPLLEGKNYAKQYSLFRQMMKTPSVIDSVQYGFIQDAANKGEFD